MASAVLDSAAAHDAQLVAKTFAEQYYKRLLETPSEAHLFYTESSVVSWPGSDGNSMVTVTTTEKIKEMITSEDYDGCQALVETIDGQDSQYGGVVVVVTGIWKGKESSRNFSETFFLANSGPGSYFVLNDVFKFVDHQEPVSLTPSEVEESSSIVVGDNEVVPAPPKEDQPQPPAALVAAVETHPKKALQDDVVVNNNNKKEAKEEAINNDKKKVEEEEKDREARSIYVGNLPYGIRVSEVSDSIKKRFGAIRKGGVQVRNNNKYGYSYGFVEFETQAFAALAIRVGKIYIGKYEAHITPKRRPNHGNPSSTAVDKVVPATPKEDQAVEKKDLQVVRKAAETLPPSGQISYATMAAKEAAANSGAPPAAPKVVVVAPSSKHYKDPLKPKSNTNTESSPSLPHDDVVVVVNAKPVAPNSKKKKEVEEKALNNKKTEVVDEEEDRQRRSVYVDNLPVGIQQYEVRNAFKKKFGRFGAIRKVGVRERISYDEDDDRYYKYCYGFVEFESAADAAYAIEIGSIGFGQSEAYITPQQKRLITNHRGSGGRNHNNNYSNNGAADEGRRAPSADGNQARPKSSGNNNHQQNGIRSNVGQKKNGDGTSSPS